MCNVMLSGDSLPLREVLDDQVERKKYYRSKPKSPPCKFAFEFVGDLTSVVRVAIVVPRVNVVRVISLGVRFTVHAK